MPDPKPGTRYCIHCGSFQIVEKTADLAIYLHCNACRRDLEIFRGTKAEVRRFKKLRKTNQRRLNGLYL